MPEQNKKHDGEIIEFPLGEPEQKIPSSTQDGIKIFNELNHACYELGIVVQRSRTGEIDITRPIDDKYEQHIRAMPVTSHKFRSPSIQLQVRQLNRDLQNRNFGKKAECYTVVMSLNRGDSRAEVYSDLEEYQDITVIASVLDTSRLAVDLLFAFSALPENQRGMYGKTVYDFMDPKENLFKILTESAVMDPNVVSDMEALETEGVDPTQWAMLVYNLLHRNVTECVLYPHAQFYALEKSEEKAIALK